MALKYKIIATFKPGEGKDGKQIWFPKLTGSTLVNLDQVANILAKRSTASRADVYLIITGLIDLIPELLLDGCTIRIDNLGSFRLHVKVEPSDSHEKVSKRNIKEVRLSFKPDPKIRKALQEAKFVYSGKNEIKSAARESSNKKEKEVKEKGNKEKGAKG